MPNRTDLIAVIDPGEVEILRKLLAEAFDQNATADDRDVARLRICGRLQNLLNDAREYDLWRHDLLGGDDR